jgi:predicted alpha/beta-fold hydrolase
MPIVQSSDYQAPFWLPNGHFQSIFPSVFRKVNGVNYQRERIATPDSDFLDLDWSLSPKSKKLVILNHGLEGDSKRQYITGMVKIFNNANYSCLAWNYRSCSEDINNTTRFYHSGATQDLDLIIKHGISKGFSTIYLIGFSLGGNLTLKYLGEQGQDTPVQIKKSVVFSVPLHLSSSSDVLAQWQDWLYTQKFLRSLSKKINQKAQLMPQSIDASKLSLVKNLRDFDDHYTSVLHGFEDAEDYYQQNSSLYFLEKITIPTLIVNAKNDPFLSEQCFPISQLEKHDTVFLEIPKTGGHCGFYPKNYEENLWSEKRALSFIQAH